MLGYLYMEELTEKRLTSRVVLAILATGIFAFLGILDSTATTVTFPILMREFNVPTDIIQWVNAIVLLTIATIVPLSTIIRLRIPNKIIFVGAVIFFVIGLAIDIVTPYYWLLLVGRAMQAVGGGIVLPLMYNIILTEVPKRQLGFMMGLGTVVTATAVAIGPVFGGIVTEWLNWRWIFIISLVIVAISFALGVAAIRQLNPLEKASFKYLQWFTLAGTLAFSIVGFTNLAVYRVTSFWVSGCIALGVVSFIAWVYISKNDKKALINISLFKSYRFSFQLIAYCCAKIATLAIGLIIPIYVQEVNGSSVALAGWIIFPGAILNACMGMWAGRLLDIKGPRLPIYIGLINSIVWLSVLSIWGRELSDVALVILYALYYSGYGLCFGTLMTSGLMDLSEEEQAQGNAIFNTLQQFCGAVGMALAGSLLGLSQSRYTSISFGQATAMGAQWTFMVLTVLLVLATVVALVSVPKKK